MKSSIYFKLFVSLMALILSGCAISVRVPGNRFDSPETMGKPFRVKLDAGLGGGSNVVLTSDYTTTPPSVTNPTLERALYFLPGAGIGLGTMMDLEIKNMSMLQLKWQLAGAPRLKAKSGNFALTLTGAAGYKSSNGNGSNAVNSATASYTLKETVFDGALILGTRVSDGVLIYFGPFYYRSSFTGSSDLSTASPTHTDFKGVAEGYGGNIGLEFGNNVVMGKLEGAYLNAKSGGLNKSQIYGGAEVCFHIGNRS